MSKIVVQCPCVGWLGLYSDNISDLLEGNKWVGLLQGSRTFTFHNVHMIFPILLLYPLQYTVLFYADDTTLLILQKTQLCP